MDEYDYKHSIAYLLDALTTLEVAIENGDLGRGHSNVKLYNHYHDLVAAQETSNA